MNTRRCFTECVSTLQGPHIANLVLFTKLYKPLPRMNLFPLPVDPAFRRWLPAGSKISLVSAPAGFEKTTVVSEWVSTFDPSRKIAWISLDRGDNDPVQILLYRIAALQQASKSIGQAIQPTLMDPLSNREIEVLHLPAQCLIMAEVAKELYL